MPELSDFRLGADVVTSDGRKAGRLVSVLVDRDGFDPRALVVKDEASLAGRLLAAERLFITDEVVIPIGAVESATREAVRLSMAFDEVRRQQPYLSFRFKPLTGGEAALQEAETLTGGVGAPNIEEVANKPLDQIEIAQEENVMLGQTGRRLGRIKEVLYDKGDLIGVVVRPDGFFAKDVILPIRLISRADDLALFTNITQSEIEDLKPFAD
jgi:sporulation protein YlmC with PRC-barrel domain